MYEHHNPTFAQPLMDELLKALDDTWKDSSWGNDCTATISYELPSGSILSIGIPNAAEEDIDQEEFNEYTVCLDSGDFWNYTEHADAIAKAKEIINK